MTPLLCAIDCCNLEAARALVALGADVRVVTPRQRLGLLQFAARRLASALWPRACACQPRKKEETESRRVEMIDWLLGLEGLRSRRHVDALGMTTAQAVETLETLRQQQQRRQQTTTTTTTTPASSSHQLEQQQQQQQQQQQVLPITLVDLTSTASSSSRTYHRSATTSPTRSPSSPPPAIRRRPLTMPPRSSTPPRSPVRSTPSPARSPPRSPPFMTVETPTVRGRPASSSFVVGSRARPAAAARRGRSSERQLASTAVHTTTSPLHASPPASASSRGLDDATLEFLATEEKATLTLVAQQAKQEALEWLKKRIGQKKLLSEARAQLQSLQRHHRRTNSGNVGGSWADDASDSSELLAVSACVSVSASTNDLLEQFKALAAKTFVDKHVAECVADARLEIEREKQHLLATTGIYPGPLAVRSEEHQHQQQLQQDRRLSRTGSLSGSMLLALGPLSPTSRTFGTDDNWSDTDSSTGRERTTNGTLVDDNLTWLSTASSLRGSQLAAALFAPSDVATRRMDERERERESDVVVNPLERPSFVHVVESRRTLS
ncbi:hypothetical protein PINS_up007044 [Pythium insidiosum]|nr:hypothetical protein PINS_up007044 [Pythium insidiosum]